MTLLKCLRCLIQGFGVSVLLSISFCNWAGVANAATSAVKPAKVVLLLHGLSSSLNT